MKKLLLILMILASAALTDNLAMAQDTDRIFFSGVYTHISRGGDPKMKALLAGTWTDLFHDKTTTFKSNGTWVYGDDDPDKWDIHGGEFIEIRPAPAAERPYLIILLTQHECIMQQVGHSQGYMFLTR